MFSVTLQSVRPQVMSFTVPPRGVTSRTTSWGGSSGRAERRRASKSSEGASGGGVGVWEAVGSRSSRGENFSLTGAHLPSAAAAVP